MWWGSEGHGGEGLSSPRFQRFILTFHLFRTGSNKQVP